MKICFLSSMHPAKDKRVFDKEAVSLSAAGFDVLHLCPGLPEENGVEKGVRIQTYERPKGIRGRIKQLFMLYKLARNAKADVYHCNEVDSWLVGVALRIALGKKCVFDVHEHYPSTFAQSRFPEWLQPAVAGLIKMLFLFLTPFTHKLVLAKRSVSSDFRTKSDKKVLVQNFTPVSSLNVSGHTQFSDGADYVLIHLGLLSKVRGWPAILDGMSMMSHKNLKFVVIGEINDGTREEFDLKVDELGLADRVKVHDWMPFDEAFLHLASSDIGIIAFQPGIQNHVFAMPHKMFDYMAAGLPVLLPDFAVEVAPIVLESDCGMLIDPASPKDIAEKMDYLLSNPSEMKRMGKSGKEAVLQRYNWEAEALKLVEMYREMEASL